MRIGTGIPSKDDTMSMNSNQEDIFQIHIQICLQAVTLIATIIGQYKIIQRKVFYNYNQSKIQRIIY